MIFSVGKDYLKTVSPIWSIIWCAFDTVNSTACSCELNLSARMKRWDCISPLSVFSIVPHICHWPCSWYGAARTVNPLYSEAEDADLSTWEVEPPPKSFFKNDIVAARASVNCVSYPESFSACVICLDASACAVLSPQSGECARG